LAQQACETLGTCDAVRAEIDRETPAKRLRSAQPHLVPPASAQAARLLAWFHVPKCGSSFLNALIKAPGACPAVPQDVIIHTETFGPDNIYGFYQKYNWMNYCPGLEHWHLGEHYGFGRKYSQNWENKFKGHAVGMFREPGQRLLSGWKDYRHSWPASQQRPPPASVLTYAAQVQGCMVKMMTRPGVSYQLATNQNFGAIGPHWGGPCGEGPLPSREEVDLAKSRLEHFAFFGLVEEWKLSMCLFHKIVGGPCHMAEFVNSRTEDSSDGARPSHNTAPLMGFVDKYDTEFYEAAKKLFRANLVKHGVSHKSCSACYEEAGRSAVLIIKASQQRGQQWDDDFTVA